jgi:hypothetical protein
MWWVENTLEITENGVILKSKNPKIPIGENVLNLTDLDIETLKKTLFDAHNSQTQTQISYLLFTGKSWHRRYARVYYAHDAGTYVITSRASKSNILHLTPVSNRTISLLEEKGVR